MACVILAQYMRAPPINLHAKVYTKQNPYMFKDLMRIHTTHMLGEARSLSFHNSIEIGIPFLFIVLICILLYIFLIIIT